MGRAATLKHLGGARDLTYDERLGAVVLGLVGSHVERYHTDVEYHAAVYRLAADMLARADRIAAGTSWADSPGHAGG